MARIISQRLQQALGQSVVVENRAGGGGSVAAKVVATADPDGYTLLFCNTSIMTTIPAVAKRPDYNPVKDFSPIARSRKASSCWCCIRRCRRTRSRSSSPTARPIPASSTAR
jgi:tripartite-type tricarboxylate transporter receptor subunit TctC